MVRRAGAADLRQPVCHLPKLIRAAADFAERKGPPPDEWTIWEDWQFFGLPPEAGGLNDQPAGLLDRIRVVLDVVQALTSYRRDGQKAGESATWKNEHPHETRVVSWVERVRRDGFD